MSFVVIEDLNVANMPKNHHLAPAIDEQTIADMDLEEFQRLLVATNVQVSLVLQPGGDCQSLRDILEELIWDLGHYRQNWS
jgi:hypothetical protein